MLALNDRQLAEIRAVAIPLPPHLRGRYLQRVADLLPSNPGDDVNVWRIAQRARAEIFREAAKPGPEAA
jgi:hypothetical protein